MNYTKTYIKRLDETLFSAVHETGLRIYLVPKKGFSKTYAIYGTKFGSVNNHFIPLGSDKPIQVPDGVAHFLEHKMFEQPDGSNAFDLFSKYGANANAFTSFTNTCYLFSCTSHFNECFTHLINYVQEPYYTKENIEKEQGIIGQEIRMYDDDGEWLVMFNLLKALYTVNPVRTDIAGTVESIAQINKDTLYNCYNTYYNPANMVLCVIGDVDPDKVFAIVESTVTNRENGRVESIFPVEPDAIATNYIEAKSSVSRPLFNIGFKDVHLKIGAELLKREAEIKLIMKMVAGRSSKFYNDCYKSGLINDCFDTDVMTEQTFSCGMFCGESDNPKQVKKEILKVLQQYSENGFEGAEFERIRDSYFGSFIRSFNDVESVGTMLCKNFLNDVNILDFPEIYYTITPKSLLSTLREVFTEQNCALSVVVPNETDK